MPMRLMRPVYSARRYRELTPFKLLINAYKFLMRPTVGQQGALTAMLRDHCTLYNAALQERRDAWRHASKTTVRYGQQSAQLKDIRACDPDQARWSFSSQQATLRRLDKAFAAFFRRVKAGEKPGCPRFRSNKRFDTADFPKDGDGCRWDSTPHDPVTRVRLQDVGPIRVHQHRPLVGQAQPEPLPATRAVVGIDLGIANFLADSNGEFVPNPQHGAKAAAKLEAAQQALSRCKHGSKRRRRAVETVARLHRKVRRQRLDHAHKTALDLVRGNDFIAHEDLKIRNMSKAPARKPDVDKPGAFLPNGASAKAGLNRSINDAGREPASVRAVRFGAQPSSRAARKIRSRVASDSPGLWLKVRGTVYIPFLYMPSEDLGVISTSLFRFKGPFGAHWETISAGAVLVILPTLIVFLLLQRFIYNGFMRGATR